MTDSFPSHARSVSMVLLACSLAVATAAVAQTPVADGAAAAPQPGSVHFLLPLQPGEFDAVVKPFKPLKFSDEAKALGLFSNISNGVFKPDGNGPFPAIVLVHSCGGISPPQLRERAKELLDAGYVVLMLDSFGPRNQTNCRNGVIKSPLVWRDTLDALAHLHTLPVVDKQNIFQVGYSLGSISAAALSSPSMVEHFGGQYRFKASVGWYGSCGYQAQASAPNHYFVRTDTDRPLLLLMAEADRETPIDRFCFPLLENMKAAGKPVDWHVYGNGVTHAWDVRSGYSLTTSWGEQVVNRFDAQATADATQRTLAFLKQQQQTAR